MITDELGIALHDRATRGVPLSDAEQAQLQAWYEEKDREETALLKLSSAQLQEAESALQMRQLLTLITELTRQNETIAKQNEVLISEVAALRQQLAGRVAA